MGLLAWLVRQLGNTNAYLFVLSLVVLFPRVVYIVKKAIYVQICINVQQ